MWMGDIVETNRSLLDDEFVDPLKMESSWWPSSNPGALRNIPTRYDPPSARHVQHSS